MKDEKLIEHETQKDADAYKRAWEACEREVTPYAVANLKLDCADLQKFSRLKKEDLRQPVPVKTAKELVAMASATNETFHATLRPLVERAGGTYEKGPPKNRAAGPRQGARGLPRRRGARGRRRARDGRVQGRPHEPRKSGSRTSSLSASKARSGRSPGTRSMRRKLMSSGGSSTAQHAGI